MCAEIVTAESVEGVAKSEEGFECVYSLDEESVAHDNTIVALGRKRNSGGFSDVVGINVLAVILKLR